MNKVQISNFVRMDSLLEIGYEIDLVDVTAVTAIVDAILAMCDLSCFCNQIWREGARSIASCRNRSLPPHGYPLIVAGRMGARDASRASSLLHPITEAKAKHDNRKITTGERASTSVGGSFENNARNISRAPPLRKNGTVATACH